MRSEESCCTGSGLRGVREVNLEACLENRGSARKTDRGFGVGGIVYLVFMIRKKRNSLLQRRKCISWSFVVEKFARRRNPYKL